MCGNGNVIIGKLQLSENNFQRLLHRRSRSIQEEVFRAVTNELMLICLGNGLMENITSKFMITAGVPKLIEMAKLVTIRFRNL